ncbi:TAF6 [Scenedesmus sp. PABB004]|nr:TAF6 [Scenedesmus sp. PABB004]
MSIIQPAAIKAIAHSVQLERLSDEAAKTLAPDVEYRLREVVQEALKFAKHAKRTTLTAADVNDALRLRNVEPVYGFAGRDPAKFSRVATHPELMYVRDPEMSYHELIEAPLPRLPREPGVTAHWLAVNGVQPDLPENTPLEAPPTKRSRLPLRSNNRAGPGADGPAAGGGALAGADAQLSLPAPGQPGGAGGAGAGAAPRGQPGAAVDPRGAAASAAVQLQLPLRHAVSRELQVYFDKIVGLLLTPTPTGAAPGGGAAGAAGAGGAGAGSAAAAADRQASLLRGAFASVASDPGLHPLVPYFVAFIADGVVAHLRDLALLGRLLQLGRCLLANPGLRLEPYLPQLLPAVVTCLVTKSLGAHPEEDHWALRRAAAALLAAIAAAFAEPHHNLMPRLCRVLGGAWLDASKPLTTKYGAVVGLAVRRDTPRGAPGAGGPAAWRARRGAARQPTLPPPSPPPPPAQALGPQVVRTLLVPHLEPFMSSTLLPAMAAGCEDDGGAPAGGARAAGAAAARAQARLEAWQVYGALLSASGGAMYDALIGQLAGQLSMPLLLARRSGGGAGARPADGGGDGQPGGGGEWRWGDAYVQALQAARRSGAARRPAAGRGAAQEGQQPEPMDVERPGGAELDAAAAAAAAAAASGAQPAAVRSRALVPASGGAGARRPDGGQPGVAEVLGESWKDDSDTNATLGALLQLFGEDLLPCLPLAQLAAVTL